MALPICVTAYDASRVPVKEHDMFGFWFWILTPVALILVVAFVYDRRHDGAHIKAPEEGSAGGGPTEALDHSLHNPNTWLGF